LKSLLYYRRLVIILLPAIILTISSITSGAGDSASVESESGLPCSFCIVDCPGDAIDHAPTRQVMQVINNELHIWNEYVEPINRAKYLYLIEPSRKNLKTDEAMALLDLSRTWELQALPTSSTELSKTSRSKLMQPLDSPVVNSNHGQTKESENEPSLVLEQVTLEQVTMEDNRFPIATKKALNYPYNNIGFLNVNFPRSFMRSTAFLVGPNLALTTTHNLYSPELGGWYEKINFSAAQYETETLVTKRPYSTRRPVHVETNDKFYFYENEGDRDRAVQYDYAALFFEEPYSEISTFMPIEFNHIPEKVQVLGYPGYVRGITTSGLWESQGEVIDYNDYCLYYKAYTSGGNSGSPVLAYRPQADTYRVVAIHAFASPGYFSGGPHFNDKNQPVIELWFNKSSDFIKTNLTSISLNRNTLVMKEGEQESLVAVTAPEHVPDIELTWASSNPDVAEVTADGIITALEKGETVITVSAESGNPKAKCTVTVEAAAPKRSQNELGAIKTAFQSGRGDLNSDGAVNILDVVIVLQHILEISKLEAETQINADVNGDGIINILDATLMMQYTLGLL